MWKINITKDKATVQHDNDPVGFVTDLKIEMDAKTMLPKMTISVVDPNIEVVGEIDDENVIFKN